MNNFDLIILLSMVVAGAAPVVLAAIGETITEKAGVINLSLDGGILLSAMIAFAVANTTESLFAGFVAASAAGAAVSLIVAVFSVYLGQSQVAVGFVLALMTRDLAYFLGSPYSRVQGLLVPHLPLPFLKDIPFIGEVLFNHSITVYLSLFSIIAVWFFIYKTRPGLKLRAVGEEPKAALVRGFDPRIIQLACSALGGVFTGLAGASFSLSVKAGWGQPQGCEGTGWIALALVIFGGWNPVKAAAGAYFFSLLQVMGIQFQGWFPAIPAQVFQVAPFPLMIFTLIIINLPKNESVAAWAETRPGIKKLLSRLSGDAPTALGKPYKPDIY